MRSVGIGYPTAEVLIVGIDLTRSPAGGWKVVLLEAYGDLARALLRKDDRVGQSHLHVAWRG